MTKDVKSYKIRNSVGLYSTGGSEPTFSKNGKTWSNIGHLRNHLNLINDYSYYKDCELVELISVENDSDKNSLQQYIECSIVSNAIGHPWRTQIELTKILTDFVKNGTCYSKEFRELIEQQKLKEVTEYVPMHMIENFDLYHNKGINQCTDVELAAIILTATSTQIEEYNL